MVSSGLNTADIRRARHSAPRFRSSRCLFTWSYHRYVRSFSQLYGADYLMEEKVADWNAITEIDEESIRLREEINLQYQALQQVVRLGD